MTAPTTAPRRPPLRPEPFVGNASEGIEFPTQEFRSQPREEARLTVLRASYLIWIRKDGTLLTRWPDCSCDTLNQARELGEQKARIHALPLKFLDSRHAFEDTTTDGVFVCEEMRDMSVSGCPIVR